MHSWLLWHQGRLAESSALEPLHVCRNSFPSKQFYDGKAVQTSQADSGWTERLTGNQRTNKALEKAGNWTCSESLSLTVSDFSLQHLTSTCHGWAGLQWQVDQRSTRWVVGQSAPDCTDCTHEVWQTSLKHHIFVVVRKASPRKVAMFVRKTMYSTIRCKPL